MNSPAELNSKLVALEAEDLFSRLDVLEADLPKANQGPRGPIGPRGERGPKPDHRWIDTQLQFERPDGSWGEAVDLKGDPGPPGRAVAAMGGGGVGPQGPAGPQGPPGTGSVKVNGWFPAGW